MLSDLCAATCHQFRPYRAAIQRAAPPKYVPQQIAKTGVTPLLIEHSHALRVANLPSHHWDPFDRLLVAQAELEGVTLLTADRQFEPYGIPIEWV